MTTVSASTVGQTTPAGTSARRSRRTWAGLAAAAILLFGIHLLPVPPSFERANVDVALSAGGKTALAILACAVTLWVTETLPFAVTSLVAMLLIPAFGLLDFRATVRAGFGEPIIVFFVGVLLLSSAFTRSGLGTRLVYEILRRVGTRVDHVLLALLAAGSFISWWITDMAVAAMLLPLGVGLLRDADLRPLESNVGRAVMIASAFGPLIGGIATPAGTAANLVAIAQLKQLAGVEVSFLKWMAYGVPAAVLMVPAAWRVLLWLFPPEIRTLPISQADIARRLSVIGPLRGGELKTLLVFATVIALWLGTPFFAEWTGGRIAPPVEAVALAGGLALFLPGMRIVSWKQAEQDVEWGGLMLIVAGLSLGLVVYETGAARWLAWVLLGGIAGVPVVLQAFVIVLAVAALHLLFSSNTVAASIIVPILVALANELHLDAWMIVAPAAFTSSLAFILVSEGPTTIIPYSSGYFSIKDMAKAGIAMTVAAAACVALSVAINRALGN
jgi:sodium-dependent dicarboxylate transporter 2/3/5